METEPKPLPAVSSSSVIQDIPVDKIVPSPFQARKAFDETGLQNLALTIKQHGLTNPIHVRPVGDHFELIAGERRWRAVRILGDPTIRATVEAIDDQEAAARGLMENLQRRNLNPIEEAEGFAQLQKMDKKRWTQEEIGKLVGKKQPEVAEALRLLDLPVDVQQNIERSILSPGHAKVILRLASPADQSHLADQVVKGDWSVQETKRQVDNLLGTPHKPLASTKPAQAATGPDPLEGYWGELTTKTPGWSWSAYYPEEQTWQLTISLESMYADNPAKARKFMGQWLWAMAQAAGETRPDAEVQEQVEAVNLTNDMYTKLVQKAMETGDEAAAEPPQPKSEAAEEPLDPEIAKMIARRKASRSSL